MFRATLRLLLAITVLPLRVAGALLRGFGLAAGSPVAVVLDNHQRRRR